MLWIAYDVCAPIRFLLFPSTINYSTSLPLAQGIKFQ